jgi:hypothetical protein
MRLYNHILYITVKTNPIKAKNKSNAEVLKTPRNICSSLIKLNVPGNPIFAKDKNKKQNAYRGITAVNPP